MFISVFVAPTTEDNSKIGRDREKNFLENATDFTPLSSGLATFKFASSKRPGKLYRRIFFVCLQGNVWFERRVFLRPPAIGNLSFFSVGFSGGFMEGFGTTGTEETAATVAVGCAITAEYTGFITDGVPTISA